MRASSNLLFVAAVLPAALAGTSVNIQFNVLTSRAINLEDGNYTLTNVATGQKIHYVQDNSQLYPDDASAAVVSFSGTGDGPYTQLKINDKCLTAQWDDNAESEGVGADAAAIAYDCASDSSESINADKQKWLLVQGKAKASRYAARRLRARSSDQCGASSEDSSSSSGSSGTDTTTYYNTACCKKTKGWIMRHPQYVKSSEYYHIECASLLSQAQRRALNLTQEDYDNLAELKAECQAKLSDDNPAKITKRTQSSDGVYYIIALDHLDDMSPRALAGSIYQDEEDGTLSTSLDAFSEGTEDQKWRIELA